MSNNQNDAILYRLQQMNINNGSPDFQNYSSDSRRQQQQQQQSQQAQTIHSNYSQPIYQYVPGSGAGGIYENVEYSTGMQVTDLDAIDFESSNAKAQCQVRQANGSNSKNNYSQEQESLRYAHTPQPSDHVIEPSPIYENLQIVSGT
jgi:hypothetical protein